MQQEVKDLPLIIGEKEFSSRLILGTGKYRTNQEMMDALRASGTEMVRPSASSTDRVSSVSATVTARGVLASTGEELIPGL